MSGRKRAAVAALAFLVGSGGAMARTVLDEMRWQSRVLVVFAGSEAALRGQSAALLADRPALAERDMVVIGVVGDEVRALHGAAPRGATADALRAALGAGNGGFEAVLVGKDGGVKLRSREPLAADALNAVVDAMPMRRAGR